MTQPDAAIEGLLRARAKDTDIRRKRVLAAVSDLQRVGAALTISAVARAAGVHRSFLHRHPDLAAAIHAAQTPVIAIKNDSANGVSLQTELANVHAAYRRLAAHTRLLETRLSELLGQEAARTGGLLQPVDTDTTQLSQRIHELEQTVEDLRLELAERTEDLKAARTANRALMAANNHRST